MKKVLLGFALFGAAPALAQGAPAAPAKPECFIELPQLMASGPNGNADLRAAIAQLDARLRPQVEAIGRLTRLAKTLEEQQQKALDATGGPEDEPMPVATAAADTREATRISEDLRKTNESAAALQEQLKTDYQTHMTAIVGPVQKLVGERATAFSAQQGCGRLKMARAPDLAALRAAGARDLTSAFSTWYATAGSS